MNDPDAWVVAYTDLLEEVGRLREAQRLSVVLVEDLLADPFIRLGPKVQRLSEWEDAWWAIEAPIVRALGFDPAALVKPWDRIKRQVAQQRLAQSIHVEPFTKRGIGSGDDERGLIP